MAHKIASENKDYRKILKNYISGTNEEKADILAFFVGSIYNKMIDKTSDYYLPKLVQKQKNPTYEPYIVKEENLPWAPPRAPGQGDGEKQICIAGAPDYKIAIPTGNGSLTLDKIVISGISNVFPSKPPQVVSVGNYDTIKAECVFSTQDIGMQYNTIEISGTFDIKQECCVCKDDDLNTCDPTIPNFDEHGIGSFKCTIDGASQTSANISANISVDSAGSKLVVNITDITLNIKYVDDQGNSLIKFSIDITNITDPNLRGMWSNQANSVFNNHDTIVSIVDSFKLEVSKATGDLSNMLTDNINELFNVPPHQ